MRAIFLFHCDLRLIDNTSLNQAIQDGYTILPIFIFTPEQIEPSQNAYFSHPAVQFMCESLKELAPIKLFKGDTIEILTKLYTDMPYDAIYFNTSYSLYAKARDASIDAFCATRKIKCVSLEDYGLLPLMDGLVAPGKPYTVFAPFYRKVLTMPIRAVASKAKPAFINNVTFAYEYPMAKIDELYMPNENAKIRGGRMRGKKLLKNHLKTLDAYQNERNFPAQNKTSLASPHLKFGTISIREMYHAIVKLFGKEHSLVRELIFREFYLKIYTLIPNLQRGIVYLPLQIEWRTNDSIALENWKTGTTGFPLVDAGMRELNTTGHQHNRVRMLCANFLTKYLLIDWRIGMQYFYSKLVDADIFSNTAGWQWASSTGPSAIEYWRPPFNPYIQSKKFDNECLYIKQWVPELESVAPKDIHNWHNPKIREKYPDIYFAPLIEYTVASKRAVVVYKDAYRSQNL